MRLSGTPVSFHPLGTFLSNVIYDHSYNSRLAAAKFVAAMRTIALVQSLRCKTALCSYNLIAAPVKKKRKEKGYSFLFFGASRHAAAKSVANLQLR